MAQFYTVLTQTGQAKMANAIALGTMIEITALAVGDGNGSLPNPDASRTALVNEVRRAPINRVDVDGDNPNWLIVEQVLPPDVGGWTIREVGLFDADGDLVGYGNYPETYKPTLDQGSGRTLTIRMVLEVTHTAAVTLRVDPSVVLATRKYVDDQRKAHEESSNHPGATESAQGMIQRATRAEALTGTNNTRAMTPSRVHEAFKQFGLGGVVASLPGNSLDYPVGTVASGLYSVTESAGDRPVSGAAGSAIVTRRTPSGGESQIVVIEGSSGAVWFRSRQSGTWSNWQRIATAGELTTHEEGRNHPLATETERGMVVRASQVQVNTGEDDEKFVSPKKLKVWAAQWVKQATETVVGMLKVATQAQVDAGDSDEAAVTPKKLRWGVSYNMGTNGYLVLPSWLGGFIFQWGSVSGSAQSPGVFSFPIQFPAGALAGWVQINSNSVSNIGDGFTTINVNLVGRKTDYTFSTSVTVSQNHYAFVIGR
jgi:hypothetical protein